MSLETCGVHDNCMIARCDECRYTVRAIYDLPADKVLLLEGWAVFAPALGPVRHICPRCRA